MAQITNLVHRGKQRLKTILEQKKRFALDAVCMMACLLLVVGIGAFMPALVSGVADGGVVHASGAASLISENAALGYILVGLLAFLLGVRVTVLCKL